MSLQLLASELIALRRKPATEERYKAYPRLLQAFAEAVEACNDVVALRAVIALDSGYYLLAGYRQRVLEKWLALERTPEVLRLYANQLMLFGDVDVFGAANTDVGARIDALEAEALALEASSANPSAAAPDPF